MFILYNGQPFSTPDHDNGGLGCPTRYGAGWWYSNSLQCVAGIATAQLGDVPYHSIWHDNLQREFNVSSVSMFILPTDTDKGQKIKMSAISMSNNKQ